MKNHVNFSRGSIIYNKRQIITLWAFRIMKRVWPFWTIHSLCLSAPSMRFREPKGQSGALCKLIIRQKRKKNDDSVLTKTVVALCAFTFPAICRRRKKEKGWNLTSTRDDPLGQILDIEIYNTNKECGKVMVSYNSSENIHSARGE